MALDWLPHEWLRATPESVKHEHDGLEKGGGTKPPAPLPWIRTSTIKTAALPSLSPLEVELHGELDEPWGVARPPRHDGQKPPAVRRVRLTHAIKLQPVYRGDVEL